MNFSLIEFEGTLSKKCVRDRIKKSEKKFLGVSLLVLLICTIFTIILGVLQDKEFYLVLICTIIVAIAIICCALPLPKFRERQLEKINTKHKITILDGIITSSNCFSKKEKAIDKIQKVIDMGEWYYLIFKFGDISNSWVCQKNLITRGSIEEFERIFDGKIIRKVK